jgi:hypothetical protein
MTAGAQFTSGFLATIGMLALLGFIATRTIDSIGQELHTAVEVTARKMDLIGELRGGFQDMKAYTHRTQFSIVLNRLVEAKQQLGMSGDCSRCHELETRETREKGLASATAGVKATLQRLEPLVTSASGKKCLAGISAGIVEYAPLFSEYLSLIERNSFDDARVVLHQRMFPLIDKVDQILNRLRDEELAALNQSGQRARETVSRSRWRTLGYVFLSVLICLVILMMVRKTALGPRP